MKSKREKGQVKGLPRGETGRACQECRSVAGSRTVGTWVWGRWAQCANAISSWCLLRRCMGAELGW